ncbi:hypothetical protein ABIC83_003065 [Roseateles asaccharophilus]|uniref:hypothetical protein n=1 Tax=Roseateles asaccharophilus TaxID=582607 RepID=UPI0038332A25
MLDLNPPKPQLCRHCGKKKDHHRAKTMECPMGSFSRTLGYSSFHPTQVFEAKPVRKKGLAKARREHNRFP